MSSPMIDPSMLERAKDIIEERKAPRSFEPVEDFDLESISSFSHGKFRTVKSE